jgi:hypothetical protein
MNALPAIAAALGLSSAVGLNMTIPLLMVAILAHERAIHLVAPFDILGSPGNLSMLVVLAAIELVGDKVVYRGPLRLVTLPAAIASSVVLSMAVLEGIGGVSSGLWLVLPVVFGGLMAGAVHMTRAALRAAIPSFGLSALLSWVEDVVAALLSLCAVLIPGLIPIVAIVFLVFSVTLLGRVVGASRSMLVRLSNPDGDDLIGHLAAMASKAVEDRRRR